MLDKEIVYVRRRWTMSAMGMRCGYNSGAAWREMEDIEAIYMLERRLCLLKDTVCFRTVLYEDCVCLRTV